MKNIGIESLIFIKIAPICFEILHLLINITRKKNVATRPIKMTVIYTDGY